MYTQQVYLAEEIIKEIHRLTLNSSCIISGNEAYIQLFTIRWCSNWRDVKTALNEWTISIKASELDVTTHTKRKISRCMHMEGFCLWMIWCHIVWWKSADVSEEHTASCRFFAWLTLWPWRNIFLWIFGWLSLTTWHIFQKMKLFIVKTSTPNRCIV
jgi:hypothetical protein